MAENRRTTYKISEAARELGISIEWLREGERRGFFPPAPRDHNGHRYYTEEDLVQLQDRFRVMSYCKSHENSDLCTFVL